MTENELPWTAWQLADYHNKISRQLKAGETRGARIPLPETDAGIGYFRFRIGHEPITLAEAHALMSDRGNYFRELKL